MFQQIRPDQLSGVDKGALSKGSVSGDRAFILDTGAPLALAAPSGEYIVGTLRAGAKSVNERVRSGEVAEKDRFHPNLFKKSDVRVDSVPMGARASKNLGNRVVERVRELGQGTKQRRMDRVVRRAERRARDGKYMYP